MVEIDHAALELVTPGAQPVYREMFQSAAAQLEPFGILATELRAAHFLAQVLHETGGLRLVVENLNYRAERLLKVWPSRFPTLASALPFAQNPRALANKVYGGRLGNVGANDGWTFIGRGLLQLTGRNSYERIGAPLGLDLVGSPSLVLDPAHGLRIAGEIWRQAKCNYFADLDDIQNVTRRINGGLIGIEDRQAWLMKTRRMVSYVIPE